MNGDSELELGSAQHQVPSDQRQILCLSGGGYRGLYTALVLEALEEWAKRPLTEVFDVIAGTSIGGLIAAALALNMPAASIRATIEAHGPAIFDQRAGWGRFRLPVRNPIRALYRARYSQRPLRQAIDVIFGAGANILLSSVSTPLIMPAVNLRTGAPVVLLSAGLAGKGASDLGLRDALLATSAAPAFFPPHRAARGTFVDGGLVANAPELVAVTETIRRLGCQLDDVRVLSVGTAGSPHATRRPDGAPGVIAWLVARGLVQLTLSAQEQLAVDQCGVLLRERYLRLDHLPAPADRARIGLDEVTEASTEALHRAAEITINALSGSNRSAIRRFLSHRSQGPRRPPIG